MTPEYWRLDEEPLAAVLIVSSQDFTPRRPGLLTSWLKLEADQDVQVAAASTRDRKTGRGFFTFTVMEKSPPTMTISVRCTMPAGLTWW